MKFFFGLGNPGKEYQQTRHNVGFMVIDRLAAELAKINSSGVPSWQSKQHSLLLKYGDIFLAKPDTFMNLSGQAVREVLSYYQKETSFTTDADHVNLWIVHDDLDLELGRYKIQLGTGPKVHNGLSSIYQHLGSERFWHVRVGVDGRGGARSIPSAEYVLSPFFGEEKQKIEQVIDQVVTELHHSIP